MIVLCPWAINTSRTLWGDDAAEFNPERWLTNEGKINSKGGCLDHNGFLTFLHGPRSCIGQKFAQAELACLLAIWVSSFETRLENDQPLKLKGGVSANPSGGIWVFLKRLDIYERELVA
jgi:cytochrome P450